MTEMINAGTTFVQKQFRANIYQACKAHGIAEGDRIQVFLKLVDDHKL